MRRREDLDRLVREQIAAGETDTRAAEVAREEIAADEQADALLRHARESRGTPLPDDEEG